MKLTAYVQEGGWGAALHTLSYQLSRGQMTLLAVSEQVRRQLQGHRTYFLPGGGGAMGCNERGGRAREGEGGGGEREGGRGGMEEGREGRKGWRKGGRERGDGGREGEKGEREGRDGREGWRKGGREEAEGREGEGGGGGRVTGVKGRTLPLVRVWSDAYTKVEVCIHVSAFFGLQLR